MAIEALDPEQLCEAYWKGKAQRQVAAVGLLPGRRHANAVSNAKRGSRKRNRCVGTLPGYQDKEVLIIEIGNQGFVQVVDLRV